MSPAYSEHVSYLFQFHKVRLKHRTVVDRVGEKQEFQFHKVRLKRM